MILEQLRRNEARLRCFFSLGNFFVAVLSRHEARKLRVRPSSWSAASANSGHKAPTAYHFFLNSCCSCSEKKFGDVHWLCGGFWRMFWRTSNDGAQSESKINAVRFSKTNADFTMYRAQLGLRWLGWRRREINPGRYLSWSAMRFNCPAGIITFPAVFGKFFFFFKKMHCN